MRKLLGPGRCAVALAALVCGCAEVEPSPRGHSPWRPVVLVSATAPPMAVLQGEGGPVEFTVTNAGFIPVRVIEVVPSSPLDDGAHFDGSAEGEGAPVLEPGEEAKATAVVRPTDVGASVTRRFEVRYAYRPDGTRDGGAVAGEVARKRDIDVRLAVDPATAPIDEARSRARVGSQAPGVYSVSLGGWAFEVASGAVFVPDGGEPVAWPRVSLRAVAWADLFVGNVNVSFEVADEKLVPKLEGEGLATGTSEHPGEHAIPEGRLGEFFARAGSDGFTVDAALKGRRRVLVVK